MNRPARTMLVNAGLLALVCGAIALAGPLTPPAGPVGPTYKTLQEVEPRTPVSATTTPGGLGAIYKITQPGSYYLTGNVTPNYFNSAIQISASNVTLDLGGFSLLGAGATASPSALIVDSGLSNIVVRNGSAVGWPGAGFNLGAATNSRAIDLTSTANGGVGIALGDNATITGCVSANNGGAGIVCGASSLMSNCTARANQGNGFTGAYAGSISNCRAESNSQHGFYVSGATVENSTAIANGLCGFVGGAGTTLRGCASRTNTMYGFSILSAVAENCVAEANHQDGFYMLYGQAVHCTSQYNTGAGYNGQQRCVVNACIAADNHGDGVFFSNDGVITACHISNSNYTPTACGIHCAWGYTRIEGNDVLSCTKGIKIDDTNCIVIGNSVSSCATNFDIVAGNKVGVIVAAPASGAISGATGGAGVGTTDAHANISY